MSESEPRRRAEIQTIIPVDEAPSGALFWETDNVYIQLLGVSSGQPRIEAYIPEGRNIKVISPTLTQLALFEEAALKTLPSSKATKALSDLLTKSIDESREDIESADEIRKRARNAPRPKFEL